MIAMLHGLFIERLGWWILSLLLALGVWMFLVFGSVGETSLSVTVEIQGIDPVKIPYFEVCDRDDTPLDQGKLRVTIRGPKGTLNNLNRGRIQCMRLLDMNDVKDNPHTFTLRPEHFLNVPQELEVVLHTPDLKLRYIRNVERELRLAPPKAEGTPAEEYLLGAVQVVPEKVKVRIREDALAELEKGGREPVIELRAILIDKRAEDVIAPAVAADPSVKILEPAEVRAVLAVKKTIRVFEAIPIQFLPKPGLTGVARIEHDVHKTCRVTLEGKRDIIEGLDKSQIHAYIYVDRDATSKEAETIPDGAVIVNVLRPGVDVKAVDPEKVNYKIIPK